MLRPKSITDASPTRVMDTGARAACARVGGAVWPTMRPGALVDTTAGCQLCVQPGRERLRQGCGAKAQVRQGAPRHRNPRRSSRAGEAWRPRLRRGRPAGGSCSRSLRPHGACPHIVPDDIAASARPASVGRRAKRSAAAFAQRELPSHPAAISRTLRIHCRARRAEADGTAAARRPASRAGSDCPRSAAAAGSTTRSLGPAHAAQPGGRQVRRRAQRGPT
jgi:hypothetical protein